MQRICHWFSPFRQRTCRLWDHILVCSNNLPGHRSNRQCSYNPRYTLQYEEYYVSFGMNVRSLNWVPKICRKSHCFSITIEIISIYVSTEFTWGWSGAITWLTILPDVASTCRTAFITTSTDGAIVYLTCFSNLMKMNNLVMMVVLEKHKWNVFEDKAVLYFRLRKSVTG